VLISVEPHCIKLGYTKFTSYCAQILKKRIFKFEFKKNTQIYQKDYPVGYKFCTIIIFLQNC